MSKRAAATCEDCYFRQRGPLRAPREHAVPDVPRGDRDGLAPPPQPRLVLRAPLPHVAPRTPAHKIAA